MKTVTNIENVSKKAGRTILAVLLISLTCVSPMTYNAYAEENADPTVATQAAGNATADGTTIGNDLASATSGAAATDATTSATDTAATDTTVSDTATAADTDAAIATAAEDSATTTETAAPAVDASAVTDDHVLTVSTPMELMDAFKYDINSQSGQTFVVNLDADIALSKPSANAHTMDTHGKRFFLGTDRLLVKNGNTVVILGHGHTLAYDDTSTTNLTLGTKKGNLVLGTADGSDSLTVTFTGSLHSMQSLVNAVGGTVTIHNGVTLSNNVNGTGYSGGAVSVTNGAILYMDGGTIENSTNYNITWGGGVSVDGGEFHMTGGKITGNSEKAYGDYYGYGGGVSLGAHGDTSVFTMSGDAVIEGNSAPNGGGVYVGPNSTFTMSGNAAILNNTASTYGGGVYVAQGGSFTMGEDNVVKGNSAPYGGGVINFGTAVVTNVFDNDAATAGADIYNHGTLTMKDVQDGWSLSREQATSDPNGTGSASSATTPTDIPSNLAPITLMSFAAVPASTNTNDVVATVNPSNKTIDSWYYDGHRETGETDADGNAVVEHNRWNANEDTADMPQYLQKYTVSGQPTTEVMGLKAAHGPATATQPDQPAQHDIKVIWENEDGTVLFTMDDVDPADVPAAEEYNTLSGNEDPSEPDENGYRYDFEGWTKTSDSEGDVIYIADYKATPETPENPDDPAVVPDDPTPTNPNVPADPDQPEQPSYPADEPVTHEEGEVAGPATPATNDDASAAETQTTEDGTIAPRLGDNGTSLLLVMGVSLVGAAVALRQARRAREL